MNGGKKERQHIEEMKRGLKLASWDITDDEVAMGGTEIAKLGSGQCNLHQTQKQRQAGLSKGQRVKWSKSQTAFGQCSETFDSLQLQAEPASILVHCCAVIGLGKDGRKFAGGRRPHFCEWASHYA